MKMIDKKLIGEANRLAILKLLHRFGWLTSRMVGELVWLHLPSRLAMAQRTLSSMVDAKLVVRRKLPSGGDAYLLASKGANLLKEEHGIPAESGARLQLGNHLHRSASNWYLIRQIAKGNEVRTEHEIQTGKVPIPMTYGKVSDGFVITEHGVVWLEVENAWKNRDRRTAIVDFCAEYLSDEYTQECLWGDNFLFRVEILAITPESGRAMARSLLEAYKTGQLKERVLESIWILYAPMTTGLIYPDDYRVVSLNVWHDCIVPNNLGSCGE